MSTITTSFLVEWFFWRDIVPLQMNIVSMMAGILAAARVLNSAGSTSVPHQTMLNKQAALLGAFAVSLQALAYFIEKLIEMKVI